MLNPVFTCKVLRFSLNHGEQPFNCTFVLEQNGFLCSAWLILSLVSLAKFPARYLCTTANLQRPRPHNTRIVPVIAGVKKVVARRQKLRFTFTTHGEQTFNYTYVVLEQNGCSRSMGLLLSLASLAKFPTRYLYTTVNLQWPRPHNTRIVTVIALVEIVVAFFTSLSR